MAVKYRCTKCERKFVDWGVEKVKAGEACEDCTGEHLEQIGFDPNATPVKKKPALKRARPKKKKETEPAPQMASSDDDDFSAPDLDTLASGDTVDDEVESYEADDEEEDDEDTLVGVEDDTSTDDSEE